MNPLFAFSTRVRVHRYTVTGKHAEHGEIELHLSSRAAATVAWHRLFALGYAVTNIKPAGAL